MPAYERNAADALENVQDPSCGIEGRGGKACWLTPALVYTEDYNGHRQAAGAKAFRRGGPTGDFPPKINGT